MAIPTRNGEKFLREALQSIVAQTRQPDQVVISDDASSDGTHDLCLAFARTAPFTVDVVRHIPEGITANYLNALGRTNGDIVVFSDQDDVWMPQKLAAIEDVFLSSSEVSITASDSAIVNEHLQPSGNTLRGGLERSRALSRSVNSGNDIEAMIKGLPLLAHTLAVRGDCRPALLAKPEIPEEWWFETWISMMSLSMGRLVLIPEALTLYRQHSRQAAGAPKASLRPQGSVNSYVHAAARYQYMATFMARKSGVSLVDANALNQRKALIEDYVGLLNVRSRVILRRRLFRPLMILNPHTLHKYSRYTSGIKSILHDLLRRRETPGVRDRPDKRD